ncbi:MAG TPA: glycosyltransferase family 4 protein [Nitrososphaerales archaeon]|nr:glycosyltransferase family 4 protein [Nitrososphaerales archaeon]
MSGDGSRTRVVRLVEDYPIGGRATYGLQPVYTNLSEAQALHGYNVHVIARRHPGQPGEEEAAGVNIHRVSTPYTISAMKVIRELADGHSRTVLHTHSTSGVFLSVTKNLVRAPVVSHVHGTTYSAVTPSVLILGKQVLGYSPWRVTTSFLRERALWSRANRIAAVSSSVRSDLTLRYGVKDERIRVVYNGVNTSVFKPVDNPEFPERSKVEGKKVVLYVGHFGLRKGLPFLLSAMNLITAQVQDAVLMCVGGVPPWLPKDEYWEYLNLLIEQHNLKGKVVLVDRVPNTKLPDYYSACDVFVLPSFYEAFPKVLIEAMACGKPVVTTKLGGTRDSTEDGVNGFLVPYADPEGLAAAIVRLLQDEGLARKMGQMGRARATRDFTWGAVVKRIDSIYEEVLG